MVDVFSFQLYFSLRDRLTPSDWIWWPPADSSLTMIFLIAAYLHVCLDHKSLTPHSRTHKRYLNFEKWFATILPLPSSSPLSTTARRTLLPSASRWAMVTVTARALLPSKAALALFSSSMDGHLGGSLEWDPNARGEGAWSVCPNIPCFPQFEESISWYFVNYCFSINTAKVQGRASIWGECGKRFLVHLFDTPQMLSSVWGIHFLILCKLLLFYQHSNGDEACQGAKGPKEFGSRGSVGGLSWCVCLNSPALSLVRGIYFLILCKLLLFHQHSLGFRACINMDWHVGEMAWCVCLNMTCSPPFEAFIFWYFVNCSFSINKAMLKLHAFICIGT